MNQKLHEKMRLQEVIKMNATCKQTSTDFSYHDFWGEGAQQDSCPDLSKPQKQSFLIDEDETPASAFLKVERRNDPFSGMDEDEIQDLQEYIRLAMMKDYTLILQVPKQENDFFLPKDLDEFGNDVSAFNTIDFQRKRPEFDRNRYRNKKLLERAKDLAVLYSSTSGKAEKEDQKRRFFAFIDSSHGHRVQRLSEMYGWTKNEDKKATIKAKIAELNREIIKMKAVWEQYSK